MVNESVESGETDQRCTAQAHGLNLWRIVRVGELRLHEQLEAVLSPAGA